MRISHVTIRARHDATLQTCEISQRNPAPTELLLRTQCTYISAGTELSIFTGTHPQVDTPGAWGSYPFTPGYAHIGVVESAGADVKGFAPGDRVFTFTPHQSHHFHDVATKPTVKVPDGLDSVHAAAARMAVVAIAGLQAADARLNDTVAVFGLGAVGNLCAQLCRANGYRVIGVDPMEGRRRIARDCGLSDVLGGDAAQVALEIRNRTDGHGAAVTIDAVGDSRIIEQIIPLTADFGRVILLGSPRVPVQGDLTKVFADIHLRMLQVRGALEWRVPLHPPGCGLPSVTDNIRSIFDMILRGALCIDPLISHRLEPEQIQAAYEGLLNDKEHYTGVALLWK